MGLLEKLRTLTLFKLPFKTHSMSLGLVLLEEKLLTCTPPSDAIMSAD